MVSQSSVSKCIREVSDVMSKNLLKKYVKFPGDQSTQTAIKEEFFQYCGLGGVLGAIDCTHVAIVAPPNDGYHHEKNYVNRKGWHSINAQLVCDMNMRIMNVVARFPGCTHDAFIWQSCNLKKAFDNGSKIHGDGWLLGDSGYPQENHLHIPYHTVTSGSNAEQYNDAHSRGRCVIERCNSILKNRFRCLLKHRTLHYMPETACKIINTCIILHNMCVEENMSWEEYDLPAEDELFNTVNE
ncbi:unnamed protein product [Larinioides sclopetarius]|uniref:DDE Tnp4 domain-containing protein n=1 Tax=Larinioides sclopetarius TaxID=280406 RepID=A0AAV1YT84_9ARAC